MCNGLNHAPNCKCGFGGDTSALEDAAFRGLAFTKVSDERGWHTYPNEEDFCRPTRCPECDADVFFVRHNGGSVWLDPPLDGRGTNTRASIAMINVAQTKEAL